MPYYVETRIIWSSYAQSICRVVLYANTKCIFKSTSYTRGLFEVGNIGPVDICSFVPGALQAICVVLEEEVPSTEIKASGVRKDK